MDEWQFNGPFKSISVISNLWKDDNEKLCANETLLISTSSGIETLTRSSSGPGCSKLSMSLVNFLSKFQTLLSNIRQYFLLKKCEKLLHCKSFSHFFNKKYQWFW